MNPTDPNQAKPPRATTRPSIWNRVKKPLAVSALCCLTVVVIGTVILYKTFTAGLPDVTQLDSYDPAQTTKIYAADGTLVSTLFDENRTPVAISEISQIMQTAMVAIEDHRFFAHEGVDPWGIVRAAVGNFRDGGIQQGASTLTMQLARRLYLSDEQSYTRKFRESVLAYRIDKELSKEKILELYLNEVYFGSGAYGIDAAASLYFGVNPKELNLWQSALLAGLVQAPSAYSPLEDREAALVRTEEVLEALLRQGKITEAQKSEALKAAKSYEFVNHGLGKSGGMMKYPYFTSYVIKELSKHFPENRIRRGGLQITTTLNIALQDAAEKSLQNRLETQGYSLGADTGAVVVLDNVSGDILALVGGPKWSDSDQFNRAWQAKRQPGSTFKMFVYAAALENGFNPEQEFADTEATFSPSNQPWKPANSDGKFMGAIPLRSGLQFSRNLVAAKVAAHVGPSKIATLAHKMGIQGELPEVISLSLGAGEVTPLEMTRAYSALPNNGVLRSNRTLVRVTDPQGEVLKDFRDESYQSSERVLSPTTAASMCEMLRRVVVAGTGTSASVPGAFIAGKTGTTDKFTDAWFVGFSPGHTIGVWIGRDDNQPMGRIYGGSVPADVFRDVAQVATGQEKHPATLSLVNFQEPVSKSLCWDSTYLALPSCSKTYQESFSTGIVPKRDCPIHRLAPTPTAPAQTIVKTSDGTLTNQTFALTSSPTPAASPGKDFQDPRLDPEVVSPRSALINYQEKAPQTKFKLLKIEKPTGESTPSNETQESLEVETIETTPIVSESQIPEAPKVEIPPDTVEIPKEMETPIPTPSL